MPKPRRAHVDRVGGATGSVVPARYVPPTHPAVRLAALIEGVVEKLREPGASLASPEAQECAASLMESIERLEDLMRFAAMGERKEKYGLTPDDFWDIVAGQGFRCAICTGEFVPGGPRGVVDHNHASGEARGILCAGCNTGIGHLKDSPDVLRRAVAYLESWGYYGPDLEHGQ